MNYPEMVNKSLMQCENTVDTTLTESLMCVNLVSDIYNLMVVTQKQNMERTIAYNGCVIYHSNFVLEVIQDANMTAEEYCNSLPDLSMYDRYVMGNDGKVDILGAEEPSTGPSSNESIHDLSFSFSP